MVKSEEVLQKAARDGWNLDFPRALRAATGIDMEPNGISRALTGKELYAGSDEIYTMLTRGNIVPPQLSTSIEGVGTGGWITANGNVPVVQSTDFAAHGSSSLKITAAAATFMHIYPVSIPVGQLRAHPGQVVYLYWEMYSPVQANITHRPAWRWYDSSMAVIQTDTGASGSAIPVGAWTPFAAASPPAPAGAAWVNPIMQTGVNINLGESVYVDKIMWSYTPFISWVPGTTI